MTAVAEKAPLSAACVGRATRDCTRLPAEGYMRPARTSPNCATNRR